MPASLIRREAVLMGTDVELIAWDADEARTSGAFDAALAEMARIEAVMSEWREETLLSRINRMAGVEGVPVSDELFRVIAAAKKISGLAGGAFDISVAALRGVWNFSSGKERIPSEAEIRERLPLIDYREIDLDGERKTVFLRRRGMAIGLGGIAKGYAVDRAMQVLSDRGVRNAIVKAGGDMRIQGTRAGEPWEIGIRHPRERGGVLGKVPLSNISISTSGDYERFFVRDEALYHHILDPRTGHPARECRSVTILAPDTMTSDVLATAVFVLGPAAGLAFIRKLPGIEGLVVDAAGKLHPSPGMELRGTTD